MKRLAKRLSEAIGGVRSRTLMHLCEGGERFLQSIQGKGTFDSLDDEVDAIVPLLPQRDVVVVDAGANWGNWTRALLGRVETRGCSVYMLEPAEMNLKRLSDLASSSDPARPADPERPRVRILPVALSDRVGSTSLFTSEEAPYLGSLFARRLDHQWVGLDGVEEVRTTTIDHLVESERLARIDFLKMDIEGAELSALAGARRSLERSMIRALSFELGGANVDSKVFFKDFWYLLRDQGFELFRVMHGGWLLRIDRYDERLECFRKSNYVAALDGRM